MDECTDTIDPNITINGSVYHIRTPCAADDCFIADGDSRAVRLNYAEEVHMNLAINGITYGNTSKEE